MSRPDSPARDRPELILLMGCQTTWTEAEWHGRADHGQSSRADCPNGCAGRDLEREQRQGLNRLCLRCQTHTNDRPGWMIPISTAYRIRTRIGSKLRGGIGGIRKLAKGRH